MGGTKNVINPPYKIETDMISYIPETRSLSRWSPDSKINNAATFVPG